MSEKSSQLIDQLESLSNEADQALSEAARTDELEKLRVQFLGKKGRFSAIMAELRSLSNDEKKEVGQKVNELKKRLEDQLEQKQAEFERKELDQKLREDTLDASVPGVSFAQGSWHPIRLALRESVGILERAGLEAAYGPEVEYEDYCFDKLNFQPGHPARDMQATFFVREHAHWVLRTHTSPVQVRVLLDRKQKGEELPIRVQAPGRVYRVDDDSTHAPMFHQVEGLVVDQHSGMAELRATLDFFLRHYFGQQAKIRFRPSFFPFTEPSAEVDVSCVFCSGRGCRVCKSSGWLEVAGAGLVHPQVFRECGWDPETVQGWAFGMGIERLAMLKYHIPDLRAFFDNRLSFLRGRVDAYQL